jgi:hypothetical protein
MQRLAHFVTVSLVAAATLQLKGEQSSIPSGWTQKLFLMPAIHCSGFAC